MQKHFFITNLPPSLSCPFSQPPYFFLQNPEGGSEPPGYASYPDPLHEKGNGSGKNPGSKKNVVNSNKNRPKLQEYHIFLRKHFFSSS